VLQPRPPTTADGSITGGRWFNGKAAVARFPNILDTVKGSSDVAYVNDSGQTFVTRTDGNQAELGGTKRSWAESNWTPRTSSPPPRSGPGCTVRRTTGRSGLCVPDRCAGHGTVEYLFERGSPYDAEGDRDYGFRRAVLWSDCSS
jgi:hypothetical protein